MRSLWLICLAWLGMGWSGLAAEPARVRLFCLSVRVEPGEANLFGLEYRMTFSSANFSAPNSEVYPIFEDDLSHASGFLMEAPDFPEPLQGDIGLNVPESADANTNGIPDFYEVAAGLPSTSTDGLWASEVSSGTVRSVWQRESGQRRGTVKIQITSDEFGVLPEFSHAFEILEYEGSLTYSGAGETRSGRVSLKRTGLETATLAGPLVLTRVATNRLHQFTVGESHLTNEVGEVVPVSLGDLERDADYSMDYFGALSLLNGDPATPEPDYELFYIGIDDPNDTDGDGIPDLTDDLQAPPPAPRLEVRRTASGLELVVTSEVGAEFTLEHASRLAADEWIEDRRVTIKSVPEILAVPLGPQEERYFRLRWP